MTESSAALLDPPDPRTVSPMRKDGQKFRPVRCSRCGDYPEFITSIPEPLKGQLFRVFESRCGIRTWVAEKA
jgi:hypothetical protein